MSKEFRKQEQKLTWFDQMIFIHGGGTLHHNQCTKYGSLKLQDHLTEIHSCFLTYTRKNTLEFHIKFPQLLHILSLTSLSYKSISESPCPLTAYSSSL